MGVGYIHALREDEADEAEIAAGAVPEISSSMMASSDVSAAIAG